MDNRNTPVLSIRNYSKTYGEGKRAADNVSLDVYSGDIYGFIGHNGAGNMPAGNRSLLFDPCAGCRGKAVQ